MPTGRGTPTGGRSTLQLSSQTNGMSSPGSNPLRGGSVVNAYPLIYSRAGWSVQARVAPPTISPTATQMDHPTASSTAVRTVNHGVLTPPPEPQSEGASRGSGSPNEPEPRGNETAAEVSKLNVVMDLDK